MVDEQLRQRGIATSAVLAAMRTVPRHEFVPDAAREHSYEDRALSLGPGRSISQPYVVAVMTELAAPRPGERVLEIGTGSGYQAAVLAELNADVYTIESNPEQARRADETLRRLCYRHIKLRCADGREGWPEAAPFDAILVTASVRALAPAWTAQLAPHGRLVVPLGRSQDSQVLRLITKDAAGRIATRDVMPVRFVPLA
jgi:protein-L-isoaspartate(D-aspartate) O-methyltransferase